MGSKPSAKYQILPVGAVVLLAPVEEALKRELVLWRLRPRDEAHFVAEITGGSTRHHQGTHRDFGRGAVTGDPCRAGGETDAVELIGKRSLGAVDAAQHEVGAANSGGDIVVGFQPGVSKHDSGLRRGLF